MRIDELDYFYPEELVATQPKAEFRTLLSRPAGAEVSRPFEVEEITKAQVLSLFEPGDVLVVNDTRVVKCRVFSEDGLEILFVKHLGHDVWEVLFPASRLKKDQKLLLPGDVQMELVERGLPQKIKSSVPLTAEYFEKYGEVALPPYIQKARNQRHMSDQDNLWYQTDWAQSRGSCAAPTASLHFTREDLVTLQSKGVKVVSLTLHVGLGTFLPIRSENLEEHIMHSEWALIPQQTLTEIQACSQQGRRVWALGTTVTRALESWASGKLTASEEGASGETDLFIKPGYSFQIVDVLMTNFHQPRSTLLALVSAFAGQDRVIKAYQWAIDRRFRLFSYGDLSIWMR